MFKAKLQQIENELFSREQAAMNLRGDVLDLNEKYKGTQQKHVMERYFTCFIPTSMKHMAFHLCTLHSTTP